MAPEGSVLPLAALMLVTGIANSLAMKRATNAVPNHSAYLGVLHVSILTIVFWAIAIARGSGRTCKGGGGGGGAPSWRTTAGLGAYDALATVLILLGGTKTPGSVQQLILQLSIPLTMVLGVGFLGRTPTRAQAAGAAVIVCGVAYVIDPWGGGGSTVDAGGTGSVLHAAIFAGALLPIVLGNLFKEKALTGAGATDTYLLNAHIAAWQCLFNVVLVPLGGVLTGTAGPAPPPTLAGAASLFARTGSDLAAGHACVFFGHGCAAGALAPVLAYIAINFTYNVAMTALLAHPRAGSTLMALLSAAKLPLASVAFSLPLLMGEEGAEPLPPRTLAGLAVILAGLALYRFDGWAAGGGGGGGTSSAGTAKEGAKKKKTATKKKAASAGGKATANSGSAAGKRRRSKSPRRPRRRSTRQAAAKKK